MIHTATYHTNNGSYTVSEYIVWYYNGADYGQGIHVFYLCLAIAFIVLFLLPYTIIVILSHYCMRFSLVNKFKPLIKAYSGPFKSKWRFWFGFCLWITIILFVVNGILQGTNTETMFLSHLMIILPFILAQALISPFKRFIVGCIDLFFMINYWLMIKFYMIFAQKTNNFTSFCRVLLSSCSFSFHLLQKTASSKCLVSILMKLCNKSNDYESIDEEVNNELFVATRERERVRLMMKY